MDFENILITELSKIEKLKELRQSLKNNSAFDIEDISEIDEYIANRENFLTEKKRILNDVSHLKNLIIQREQILQKFEDETNILLNTKLIRFFREKQKKLMETLNSLCN